MAERVEQPRQTPRPHGPGSRMAPGEKARDFGGTIRKLLRYMGPYRVGLVSAIILAMASVVFSVVGPKILGNATTEVIRGVQASAAGKGGIDELNNEVKALAEGKHLEPKVFQYQIAYNIIPQIGGEAFEGYTSEEMKMQNEGRKILHLPEMKVSCTCARVPVVRSHSVSVVLRTKEKISVERARDLIANAPGCKLVDDLKNKVYPMPLDTSDQDIVYVGRIREDLTDERGLNLWCCGDQVRKGAATNTIQIAELLLK